MAFQQRDVIMHREFAPETQGLASTTEIVRRSSAAGSVHEYAEVT